MVDKLLGDVDRIDLARRSDNRREQSREEAGSGPDIGHGHPRLQSQRGDDFLTMVKDIAAIGLESLNRIGNVGMLEGVVDSRIHALFLSVEQGDGNKQNGDKKSS